MQRIVEEMMDQARALVKGLVEKAGGVEDSTGVEALELCVRREGQEFLGALFERLLQSVLSSQDEARICPSCGNPRRHKGVRERGVVSSVGSVRLSGPYFYCRDCGRGQHSLDVLVPSSVSGVMKELICLLGTSMASFSKASRACERLLGIRLSQDMIWRHCVDEGHRVLADPPAARKVPRDTDLVGSCDGTMINTRQDGWRELKAYSFEHSDGVYGGAYLERSKQFVPRLRQVAVSMGASHAKNIFFVSDAAEWIDKGVSVQLPTAVRIVDIWHAYQHIHEAASKIHGEGTAKAVSWAKKWCRHLRDHGGHVTRWSLKRARYKDPSRQQGLTELLGYLDRQADRMDYPRYEHHGWPISSGPMESFCKQLGQRLKGPGMRWRRENVDPMAALVTLWSQDRWGDYWNPAA
jgi:hypothetical protein